MQEADERGSLKCVQVGLCSAMTPVNLPPLLGWGEVLLEACASEGASLWPEAGHCLGLSWGGGTASPNRIIDSWLVRKYAAMVQTPNVGV